jgi:subtilase family serine protease
MKNYRLFVITLVIIFIALFVIPGPGLASPPHFADDWRAKTTFHTRPGATTSSPTGYSPTEIYGAYGINQIASSGAGETIAIIDAYGSPTVQSDLANFDTTYELPAADLVVVKQPGLSGSDSGWALETSLDVEWAHAIAPGATILLVEAKSTSISDLMWAVDYANNNGANVVSMSWGDSEFYTETYYDSNFVNAGIAYVASSGDTGAGVCWPAASPYVTAVGGTTLNIASNNGVYSWSSETAWSNSSGGVSAYEALPAYQTQAPDFTYAHRSVPDVAFDANPNTGVSVYDSTRYDGMSGWFVVGGTSVGAPSWAGLIARANSFSNTQLYTLASNPTTYATDYHDITSGSNGYPAGTGYDLVDGLGSPVANNLVSGLDNRVNVSPVAPQAPAGLTEPR